MYQTKIQYPTFGKNKLEQPNTKQTFQGIPRQMYASMLNFLPILPTLGRFFPCPILLLPRAAEQHLLPLCSPAARWQERRSAGQIDLRFGAGMLAATMVMMNSRRKWIWGEIWFIFG